MFFTVKKIKVLALMLVVVSIFCFSLSYGAQETQASNLTMFTAPDGRNYQLYVPSTYQVGEPMPLMVFLHGANSSPADAMLDTGLNDVAEREGFIVAYPEKPFDWVSYAAWGWWSKQNQKRGKGEPASIAGIVDQIKSQYTINNGKVYIQGVSAGGAMTVIMGVTYPDVFTAIGVHCGLEYGVTESEDDVFTVGVTGGPDPEKRGNIAYSRSDGNARVVPAIVWHGTFDPIVYPVNGEQVISQMAQMNDLAYDGIKNDEIDDIAEETITGFDGKEYQHSIYKNSATNQVVMEKYMVVGMGHGIAGGATGRLWADPEAPPSMELTWQFFEQYTK